MRRSGRKKGGFDRFNGSGSDENQDVEFLTANER